MVVEPEPEYKKVPELKPEPAVKRPDIERNEAVLLEAVAVREVRDEIMPLNLTNEKAWIMYVVFGVIALCICLGCAIICYCCGNRSK